MIISNKPLGDNRYNKYGANWLDDNFRDVSPDFKIVLNKSYGNESLFITVYESEIITGGSYEMIATLLLHGYDKINATGTIKISGDKIYFMPIRGLSVKRTMIPNLLTCDDISSINL